MSPSSLIPCITTLIQSPHKCAISKISLFRDRQRGEHAKEPSAPLPTTPHRLIARSQRCSQCIVVCDDGYTPSFGGIMPYFCNHPSTFASNEIPSYSPGQYLGQSMMQSFHISHCDS